jgi:endonuclease YncB( thermonuclease family)
MVELYIYKGKVNRVVDADTVDATLDLGFGLSFTNRFRIMNYDAPETWRPKTEAERAHGIEATDQAKFFLLTDENLIFHTAKTPGIYGRWSAHIKLPDGKDYGELMIESGYEKKESYEDEV